MAEASRAQLLESVKGFLSSGDYSDLKITCQGEVFNVHKVVVCNRVEFFARAIRFPGKESNDANVDLPEDDPSVVKLLVQYMYEGEYDPVLPNGDATTSKPAMNVTPSWKKSKMMASGSASASNFPHTCNPESWAGPCTRLLCQHYRCGHHCNHDCGGFTCELCVPPTPPVSGSADQLLVHAQMYELADKYRVNDLTDLAKEKFRRACASFWDTKEFPIAANHAFCTTPDDDKGLRDVVFNTISDHMQLLEKPEIEAMMTQFGWLTFRLLKAKSKEHGWQ
ncbi:hypothetical protein BDV96DRAFT_590110 [Lophiotrema nucula]|uniref:BTB domain-containing protein n=1 Tax=Lophiotrema nucula TaxID=690887 RepID=A0A6A5YK37_9PLEO|nr:hypothetical protein BDV96DRAFT_590110 [Lophiotrema nucula]